MAVPEENGIPPPKLTFKKRRQKTWSLIKSMKMEAIFFFYATPGYLCLIALATLPLEKACRNNLGLSEEICNNLNNATIKGSCNDIYGIAVDPDTHPEDYELEMNKTLEAIRQANTEFTDNDLITVRGVCEAETASQKLQISINKYRAPLGLLGLLVIMYAGPLGDKYNKKKPFLLLPMIGELINVLAYLTTSIFKAQVPMQFHMYLERIMYALSGSLTLMLMGVFSFLAAETAEENRTFRFGVFSTFLSGLGVILQPFSGDAFELLGYVNLFLFCALTHVLGIVYIIFFVEEIKVKPVEEETKPDLTGADNPTYDGSTLELRDRGTNGEQPVTPRALPPVSTEPEPGFIKHGFQLFLSNFIIFKVNRPNSGRLLLIIIMTSYILVVFATGEAELRIPFGRLVWGWAAEFGTYYSYISFMGFIGNIIVTGLFINFLKLSDSVLAIVAFLSSISGRVILVLFKTTPWIYIAATVDMFLSTPVIAIRSLLSKVVKPEELGTAYSVMGITDVVVVPAALLVYNSLYEETIETYPPSFLLLTIALLVMNVLVFGRIKFLSGRFIKAEKKDAESGVNNNEKNNEPGAEVSRM